MKNVHNYQDLKKLIPELPPSEEKYEIVKVESSKDIPERGFVLSLLSKEYKIKKYKKVSKEKSIILFSINSNIQKKQTSSIEKDKVKYELMAEIQKER